MLAAAAEKAEKLAAALDQAFHDWRAIRAASEDLRKALAASRLAIYGRHGTAPENAGGRTASARERISPEVFRGPVTVSHMGVLPVVQWLWSEAPLPGALFEVIRPDGAEECKALFSHLLLDTDEVLRVWPDERRPPRPPQQAQAPAKEKSAFSQAKLRAWYEDRVRTWPEGKPGPTEAQDRLAASDALKTKIPRDAIRAVRNELAPADWLKPGPRKSRG
jgi:hypothetical protein